MLIMPSRLAEMPASLCMSLSVSHSVEHVSFSRRRFRMLQVKDIMTTNVVTVLPDSTMRDAASLILRHGVSGLPVVDEHDQLIGVLSEWDLLPVLESPEIELEPVGDHM